MCEYWIGDPQQRRTLVYSFGPPMIMEVYDFAHPVSSFLLRGFVMDFAEAMAGL